MRSRNAVDPRINTELKKALYDNLGKDVELALNVYATIEANAQIGFRENIMRKRKLQRAIKSSLEGTDFIADDVLNLVMS